MPFCTNCGNELSSGARFCGKCGKDQIAGQNQCANCGKELEEKEKFCSSCGTPVAEKAETKPEPKKPVAPVTPKEEKFTKEGRKIISGGPKPSQTSSTKKPPPPTSVNNSKKKKKGCRGCAITSLIILAILIVITILAYNKISDWWQDYKAEQGIETLDTEGIDGIVDIEEGDVSHLPENRKGQPEQIKTEAIKEEADIKQAAKSVEDAFANADTTQLKNLLTESALSAYSSAFKEMMPYMKDLSKAFKKRKLITSTEIYQIYEFEDDKGEKYTAAFELQPNGDWKLTRF